MNSDYWMFTPVMQMPLDSPLLILAFVILTKSPTRLSTRHPRFMMYSLLPSSSGSVSKRSTRSWP